MMHILLLLAQKVRRHRVKRITPQLMLSQYYPQHVKLYPTLHVDVFCVPDAYSFGTQRSLLHFTYVALQL